jgi:hypothetical protein
MLESLRDKKRPASVGIWPTSPSKLACVIGFQTLDELPTVHRLVQGDARDMSFNHELSYDLFRLSDFFLA